MNKVSIEKLAQALTAIQEWGVSAFDLNAYSLALEIVDNAEASGIDVSSQWELKPEAYTIKPSSNWFRN